MRIDTSFGSCFYSSMPFDYSNAVNEPCGFSLYLNTLNNVNAYKWMHTCSFYPESQYILNEIGRGALIDRNTVYIEPVSLFNYSFSPESHLNDFPENNNLNVVAFEHSDQQLLSAKKTFCLSVSQLSELVGVTRPTMYSFMKGSQPANPSVANRIKLLSLVEKTMKDNEIETASSSFLFKIDKDGISLAKSIKDEMNVVELTIAACEDEKAVRIQRQELFKKIKDIDPVNRGNAGTAAFWRDDKH